MKDCCEGWIKLYRKMKSINNRLSRENFNLKQEVSNLKSTIHFMLLVIAMLLLMMLDMAEII